ncbi:MAG: hypothetical protein R3182_10775, partial [Draconibacterium sp.]|nr:hypothetical protein [Draconibacterium sp.]
MEIYAIIQTRYGNNFFKYRIYDGKDEEQNIFYNMQFRSEARSSADVHNVDSYIPFYEWIMDEIH